jgi:hypothetical protein
MYTIIHETTIPKLLGILNDGKLFRSSIVQELGLVTQGSTRQRKLTEDPHVSLYNRKFYDKYDEVDGVYFRLWTKDTIVETICGNCILVFSKDLLNHKKFVINTTENYGFCIAPDGQIASSQFSGEYGMTITDLKNFDLLKEYKFDHYNSEVVVLDNVNLKNLIRIIVQRRSTLIDSQIIILMEVCKHKNLKLYII